VIAAKLVTFIVPDYPTRWLIVTTGHAEQDGRLQRHLELIAGAGHIGSIASHTNLSRPGRILKNPWLVASAIRKNQPDIVLFPDPELWAFGPIIARMLRAQSVIDIHEDYRAVSYGRPWIPKPMRRLFGSATSVLMALGRRTCSAVLVAAPELAINGDITLRNLPITVTPISEKPLFATTKRLVYVGAVTVDRGLWEMLELAKDQPDYVLDLVGPIDKDLREQARKWLAEQEMTDRVTIHGRRSYEASWNLAQDASIGLALLRSTPAYQSATPTKIWEYLAHGLPVLCSDLPPAKRVVTASGAGLVAHDRTSRNQAVQDLIKNHSQHAARGRAYISTFSNETTEAFQQLLSQLRYASK